MNSPNELLPSIPPSHTPIPHPAPSSPSLFVHLFFLTCFFDILFFSPLNLPLVINSSLPTTSSSSIASPNVLYSLTRPRPCLQFGFCGSRACPVLLGHRVHRAAEKDGEWYGCRAQVETGAHASCLSTHTPTQISHQSCKEYVY